MQRENEAGGSGGGDKIYRFYLNGKDPGSDWSVGGVGGGRLKVPQIHDLGVNVTSELQADVVIMVIELYAGRFY